MRQQKNKPVSQQAAITGKRATIHDVAQRAGVSIKTVSRVVNREPNVRHDTRHDVELAIAELNYSPNLAARNLAGRTTYLIGMYLGVPQESGYLMLLLGSMMTACRRVGYSLVLQSREKTDSHLIDDFARFIHERRPAGLVLTPPTTDNAELMAFLDQQDIPYVEINAGVEHRDHPSVRTDDMTSVLAMTEYLMGLGHQRIAFINAPAIHALAHKRVNGFLKAHKRAGRTVDAELMMTGALTFDSGVECSRQLLDLKNPPTAIFSANDDMALGVLRVAHERRIDVPRQLSVAGFDDIAMARRAWPSLTTVKQPVEKMAERAVELLVDYIAARNRGATLDSTHELFDNELIIRESTAPPTA